MDLELRCDAEGVRLPVRAKPRASKSSVLGVRGGRLVVGLHAPPVDGAANSELIQVLANHFGISRGRVQILRGETGREKLVLLRGVSEAEFRAKIAGLPQ